MLLCQPRLSWAEGCLVKQHRHLWDSTQGLREVGFVRWGFFSCFNCRLSSFKQRIYWLALPSPIIEPPGVVRFCLFPWEEQSLVKGEVS